MSAHPSVKRRRLVLKQERAISKVANESLEGTSYQSGIGHDKDVDIEQLPDPVPRGTFKPVCSHGPPTYVTLDLETTDLIRGDQVPHITQMAAQELSTGATFNHYIVPKLPISASAQNITKIVFINDKDMYVDGNPVIALPLYKAIGDFFTWIGKFKNVFLIAHNGRRFDFIVLTAACRSCGFLERLQLLVTGLVDSLPVFREVFPKQDSYKQEDLSHKLLAKEYNAHNAEADVTCLSDLISFTLSSNKDCLLKKSFTLNDIKHNMESNKQKKLNYPSLTMLVASGVMKMSTAENVASSGLNYAHLQTIYQRQGEDGLRNVFTVKNSEGQPRVTNTKRTLESVVPKLAGYFERLCDK